jgi:hypothetical protein
MAPAAHFSVFDVIRAEKQDVKNGVWKEGPVLKSQFPMGRKKISPGRGWRWRISTFVALGERFSVLTQLNVEKEYYRSMLGMRVGNSHKILCFHELHKSHLNWHCHLIRGSAHEVYPGVYRDREKMVGWPRFSNRRCTVPFNVNEGNALTLAAERFRFTPKGDLL